MTGNVLIFPGTKEPRLVLMKHALDLADTLDAQGVTSREAAEFDLCRWQKAAQDAGYDWIPSQSVRMVIWQMLLSRETIAEVLRIKAVERAVK